MNDPMSILALEESKQDQQWKDLEERLPEIDRAIASGVFPAALVERVFGTVAIELHIRRIKACIAERS